jgi:conjugative transfer signal peptidase TraF
MRRRFLLLCLLVSPVLVCAVAYQAGLRVNHTDSFPKGVYRSVSKSPQVGDLVTFRPPDWPVFVLARERGYISEGELMLKRIVAVPGDLVSIDAGGVTVNGFTIPHSAPRNTDLAGRPMPVLHLDAYRLTPYEVLLLSDYSPISFDGRYFGPVSRDQIQTVVVPVWTW